MAQDGKMLRKRIPTTQARPAAAILMVLCLVSFTLGQQLGYTLRYPVLHTAALPPAHASAHLGGRILLPPVVRQLPQVVAVPTPGAPSERRSSTPRLPAPPAQQQSPAASTSPLLHPIALPSAEPAVRQSPAASAAKQKAPQGQDRDKEKDRDTDRDKDNSHHGNDQHDKHDAHGGKDNQTGKDGHGQDNGQISGQVNGQHQGTDRNSPPQAVGSYPWRFGGLSGL